MTVSSSPASSAADPVPRLDMSEMHVDLAIAGMTCASCANRIERKLNKLDGVQATVNYATEKATVSHRPDVELDVLIAAVRAAGYEATPPPPPAPSPPHRATP